MAAFFFERLLKPWSWIWKCGSNEENKEKIGRAIKQGNPDGIALAILEQLEGQQARLWPRRHMQLVDQYDPSIHGAAKAGDSVILVFYSPELTHKAADKLYSFIRKMRTASLMNAVDQNLFGPSPIKRGSPLYGAVVGRELSTNAKNNHRLMRKCKRDGLSLWLPSGCLQEGSTQAVNVPITTTFVCANPEDIGPIPGYEKKSSSVAGGRAKVAWWLPRFW